MPAKCELCDLNAIEVFCQDDQAFLCLRCFELVHASDKAASFHQPIFCFCKVCNENTPRVFCRADSVFLCSSCDMEVHGLNKFASRHERVQLDESLYRKLYSVNPKVVAASAPRPPMPPHPMARPGDLESARGLPAPPYPAIGHQGPQLDPRSMYGGPMGAAYDMRSNFGVRPPPVYGGPPPGLHEMAPPMSAAVMGVMGGGMQPGGLMYFSPRFPPADPSFMPPDPFSVQSFPQANMVGKYNPEERQNLLARFAKKRALRCYNRKVKYMSRKVLADKRPRVKGRFAKSGDGSKGDGGEGGGGGARKPRGGTTKVALKRAGVPEGDEEEDEDDDDEDDDEEDDEEDEEEDEQPAAKAPNKFRGMQNSHSQADRDGIIERGGGLPGSMPAPMAAVSASRVPTSPLSLSEMINRGQFAEHQRRMDEQQHRQQQHPSDNPGGLALMESLR